MLLKPLRTSREVFSSVNPVSGWARMVLAMPMISSRLSSMRAQATCFNVSRLTIDYPKPLERPLDLIFLELLLPGQAPHQGEIRLLG